MSTAYQKLKKARPTIVKATRKVKRIDNSHLNEKMLSLWLCRLTGALQELTRYVNAGEQIPTSRRNYALKVSSETSQLPKSFDLKDQAVIDIRDARRQIEALLKR